MSLGDFSIIRDQRVMVGRGYRQSVEEVEAAWQEWVDDPRHVLATRLREGDDSRDLRASRQVVQAYISGGKWVADCPRCNGGIAAWDQNPRGCCLDCGTIYPVVFPDEQETAAAIDVLAERPDPLTRSWLRHHGESIDDLVAENERYLAREQPAPAPTRVVSVAELVRVLGHDAVAKLQKEGAL